MKILYAIQGTGNGHLSRATAIIPILQKIAPTDILVSGIQADLELPFPVKYRYYGLSFIFGKKGGVSILSTLQKLKLIRFWKAIKSLPVDEYNLIICDFEPVSAWACLLHKKTCITLSHQQAVLHPKAPIPAKKDWFGKFILKHYAPTTTQYGFHFLSLDSNHFTPVIRQAIREATPIKKQHYTVYLPAYSNAKIAKVLHLFPSIQWQVFSKHCSQSYKNKNIDFHPISPETFTQSFISCTGILCTAGFETPAEAIYMGKKLCVIPMNNQYEQQCNAEFLKQMHIPVLKKLETTTNTLRQWIEDDKFVQINYPDQTEEIIQSIMYSECMRNSLPISKPIVNHSTK